MARHLPIYDGPARDRSGLVSVAVDADRYGQLFPCRRCETWFVTVDRYDRQVVIREWHAETCPSLLKVVD